MSDESKERVVSASDKDVNFPGAMFARAFLVAFRCSDCVYKDNCDKEPLCCEEVGEG